MVEDHAHAAFPRVALLWVPGIRTSAVTAQARATGLVRAVPGSAETP